MLPLFQVVQSMQRGKGLGRSKGRIKAVKTSSDPNDDDYAEKSIKIAFKTDWYKADDLLKKVIKIAFMAD